MAWPVDQRNYSPALTRAYRRGAGLYGIGMGTFPMRQTYGPVPVPVPANGNANGQPVPAPPAPCPQAQLIPGLPNWAVLVGGALAGLWLYDRYGG